MQPTDIYHTCLLQVGCGGAVDISVVRKRVRQFQSVNRDVSGKALFCCPSTATDAENKLHLDQLIECNLWKAKNTLGAKLGVSVTEN